MAAPGWSRGLDDELKGAAYAIVAGIDGRTHHLRFSDIEVTGDAPAGAIVEARVYDDANGRRRLSLAARSDFSIEAQVTAPGATWLDRQILAKDSPLSSGGFGAEVRDAMDARIDHLVGEGLARRQGQRVIFLPWAALVGEGIILCGRLTTATAIGGDNCAGIAATART